MSESFPERLSRFTPDGAGLDRDALLFAAGRASARPGRSWMALAGALAASQVLTLVFLWPRTPPASQFGPSGPPLAVESTNPSMDPSSWLSLRERVFGDERDLTATPPDDSLVPADPPLRAFTAAPATLLN
jgi:hypothetical protein